MTINDILVKARFLQKHDTEANWLNAVDFVPGDGELVVYDVDENHSCPRLKIGDGKTPVNDLLFIDNDTLQQLFDLKEDFKEQNQEVEKRFLSAEMEISDARCGFSDVEYDTLGDAIRAQGVKINIEQSEALGENILNQNAWRALPEGEIVSAKDGVITVSHNECYGDYLEQIPESTIEPHVGYYLYRNFDGELEDECPDEAAYLTNADVASASFVKGATMECDFSRVTPAALLVLKRGATRLGRIDIICRPEQPGRPGGQPTEFDIQVKTLSGEWKTVKNGKPEDGLFTEGQLYQNFIFDPVVATAVRVLIYDSRGNFPEIMEITLHEVKSGRLLERVKPTSYDTRVNFFSGTLASCQDGDRTTYCETFTFTEPDTSDDPSQPGKVVLTPMTNLTAPEFGYYSNGTSGEITPYYLLGKEPANLIDGNSSTQTRSDYYLHSDIASGAKTPVILFNLNEDNNFTTLGGIKIEGYEYQRYNLENFEVQVYTESGWSTVANITDAFRDGEHGEDVTPLMINFETPIDGSKVRILVKGISDMSAEIEGPDDAELLEGGYIRVKEITLYSAEIKRQDNPIPFEFIFDEDVVINKFRIFAFKKSNYTPKSIFMTGKVDGEWVDIYGSANPPEDGSGDKYVSKEIYPEGFTDTFVHNLDKDYKVSAIRLYVTDRVGLNEDGTPKDGQLILNEIEFYGPALVSESKETSIGVAYDEYDTDLTQKAGDVWYFGAKVSGEKYEYGSNFNRPEAVLEADISGEQKELCYSMTVAESLEDYYCTFTIPEDYDAPFTNMLVKVKYPDTSYLEGKTCRFSDFILVNLTEAYGSGNEPTADDYYKILKTSTMTIHSQEGSMEFKSISGPRGAAGKTAYEYAVEGGYTGTEEEFARLMNSSITEIYPGDKGENLLNDRVIKSLPRSEIIADCDDVKTIISNSEHGDYLEAIRESTITPHVGCYVGDDFTTLVNENPTEAMYLTDALYGIASDVTIDSPIPYTTLNIGDEVFAHFNEGITPAAVLDLSEPTLIGAVELNCKPKYRAPADFKIEVKNLNGEWVKVFEKIEPNYNTFAVDGTQRFEFTPIKGTSVRVLIHACYYDSDSVDNQYPKILEIVVYENKTGKVLRKIEPRNVHTDAICSSGTVTSIIDGNRHTNFQSLRFSEIGEDGKSRPIPIEFNFSSDGVKISRVKIFAYHNQKHTPAKIILEAKVNGKWISLKDINGNSLGSSTMPSVGSDGKERAYTNTVLYTTDLKDTAVIDLDKEYEVTAMRLYVTSVLGGVAPLVLSDVEFYGPQVADEEHAGKIGVSCTDYRPIEIPGRSSYYWFFGAKIACEGINRGDLMSDTWIPPEVILEYKENDEEYTKIVLGEITKDKMFEDFYCRFQSGYRGGCFNDMKLYIKYNGYASNIADLVCKFTDITLVNLSQAYGEDIEPSADEYTKYRNTPLMSVQTTEGVKKYIIGNEEPPVKSVNGLIGDVIIDPPVKSVNSMTGHVTLLAKNIGAAPSGYGLGETEAPRIWYQNLNDLRTTGLYSLNKPTNAPQSPYHPYTDSWCVLVLAENKERIFQIAFNRDEVQIRDYHYVSTNNYVWSDWIDYSYGAVSYRISQDLNDAQKTTARANIDAISIEDLNSAELITVNDIDEIWGGAPTEEATQ